MSTEPPVPQGAMAQIMEAAIERDVDRMALLLDRWAESPRGMYQVIFTGAYCAATLIRTDAGDQIGPGDSWALEFAPSVEDTSPSACAARTITAALNDDEVTVRALCKAAADRESPLYAMEVLAKVLVVVSDMAEEINRGE